MKITNVDGPPGFQEFDDIEDRMTSEHVEDVREIFNTPLTGSYNWDYTVADNRIKSCLLYTSPSPRDKRQSRMPSSA